LGHWFSCPLFEEEGLSKAKSAAIDSAKVGYPSRVLPKSHWMVGWNSSLGVGGGWDYEGSEWWGGFPRGFNLLGPFNSQVSLAVSTSSLAEIGCI
jgi:hypothetical protein